MKCHECHNLETKVLESRDLDEGGSIRRRRECLGCGLRFTTYERAEQRRLAVVKKDGRREPFDRQKIAGGIYRACEKRPIAGEDIEQILADIERDVRGLGEAEVSTDTIGEMVMVSLLALDDVAYVRFASVYRSFTDVASFERELARLKQRVSR